jgi:SAM-dependent methyltransferase
VSTGLARAHDAYGAILLDALEGRQAYEIIERDDGVVWAGTPEDYFAPHRRWPAAERGALRSARGRVLDIGCGAGRVSLHLQGRGLEVVAVDESPGAVEVCRRRGVRDARVVPLAAIDGALGDFDTILLLRNNFGLAGQRRAPAVLRRLAAIARPGAVLITDSVDPRRAEHEELRADGSAAPRIRVRWRDRATPWFTYLMLRPDQMEAAALEGGWRVRRLVVDESPRYAVVLERSPTS